jgi:hypothetical protein
VRHERGKASTRGEVPVERAVAQARGTKPGAAAGSTGVKRRQALGKASAPGRLYLLGGSYGGTEGATHSYAVVANGGGIGTPTPLFEVSVAEAEEVQGRHPARWLGQEVRWASTLGHGQRPKATPIWLAGEAAAERLRPVDYVPFLGPLAPPPRRTCFCSGQPRCREIPHRLRRRPQPFSAVSWTR